MKKKALQFAIGLLIISNGVFAQWGGGNTTTGDTYRDGRVGIGTQTPSAMLHVFNPTPPEALIGSEAEFARISGTTFNNNSQFRFLLKRHTSSVGGWTNMSARLQFTTDVSNQGYMEFNPKDGFSGMAFGSELGEIMRMTTDGKVGIGTTAPVFKLQVSGNGEFGDAHDPYNYGQIQVVRPANQGDERFHLAFVRGGNTITGMGYAQNSNLFGIWVGSPNGTTGIPTISMVTETGNVGIGTINPGSFKLAVEGKIAARGIKVTVDPFPDYVFEPSYQLRSLAHLEQYINKNKHLPGIPSAEEVKKEGGIELGDMNAKLLEKVEELSLYIIEMNKKLEEQQREIERLKINNSK